MKPITKTTNMSRRGSSSKHKAQQKLQTLDMEDDRLEILERKPVLNKNDILTDVKSE